MDEEQRLPNKWQPRKDQLRLWSYLEHGGHVAVAVCHRRWGKDDVALHRTAVASVQRVGVYWHMLPEAAQARKAIWEAVNPRTGRRRIDEAFPEWMRETTRENEMFIRFKNGSTWQVVGSDNFDSLVGSPPIGVVFSEWALADPRAWPYLRPILRENKGWALFITTPRGHNHAEATYNLALRTPGYFAQKITAYESNVFSVEDLETEKAELIAEYGPEYGTAMFEQEYNCSWNAAVIGSYYGYLIEELKQKSRIGDFGYDDEHPVYTFWDLGLDDHMAVWFVQFVGDEIRWIDFESGGGVGLDDYIDMVAAKPYRYGGHYGPHDLRVRELTRGGLSRIEVAAKRGFHFKIVPNVSKADGRNALRAVLRRSWFNEKLCGDGIDALEQHRAAWDDEKRKQGNKEVQDWTCHGSDAARYVAVTWQEQHKAPAERKFTRDEMVFEAGDGGVRSNMSILAYCQKKERERRMAE